MNDGTKFGTSTTGGNIDASPGNIIHLVVKQHALFASNDEVFYVQYFVEEDAEKYYGITLFEDRTPDKNSEWTTVSLTYNDSGLLVRCRDQNGDTWTFDEINAEVWYLVE